MQEWSREKMPEFLLVLPSPFPPAEFKLLLPLLLLYTHLTASFSRTNRVSRYHKGKTSLDLNEAKHHGVLECSGISWIICKQSAYCSRQITTTPHRSSSTDRMLFLAPNQQRQSTEDTKVSGGVCPVCESVHERRTSLQQ